MLKNSEALKSKQRIDNLLRRPDLISMDIFLQAQFACYLCILTSGFMEVAIKAIVMEYCRKCSNDKVMAYVALQLRYFQNPRMETVLKLLGAFNAPKGPRALKIKASIVNRTCSRPIAATVIVLFFIERKKIRLAPGLAHTSTDQTLTHSARP